MNELDNVVSFADNMAMKLIFGTRKKMNKLDSKTKDGMTQRKKIMEAYSKKKKILLQYLRSAPFARLQNKWSFVVGVLAVLLQVFIVGRFPHTFCYTYHSIFVFLMVFCKWIYYKQRGWHYYMTDFCYTANMFLIIFLMFAPKNEQLFCAVFIWANGPLAVALGAFRNQMVFHKMDNLSSLALHMLPQLITYNLKWYTMPHEAELPEKDRTFLQLSQPDSFNFMLMVALPVGIYLLHAVIMYNINFVFAKKRIAERNYETMFNYFASQKSTAKLIYAFGEKNAALAFVGCQVSCFAGSLWLGWLNFFSFYCNTFFVCLWLTWSIWNASCFYMDYFAKKYEASMQRLEQLEQELTEDQRKAKNEG